MKRAYRAYLRDVAPSEEFRAALEGRMKRALRDEKRRRGHWRVGAAVAAVLALALGLGVALHRPDVADQVIPAAPVTAGGGVKPEPSPADGILADVPSEPPMAADRAIALVRQADPGAAQATQFWVYPDGAGAWVFYATGKNGARFSGGFWYVTEAERYPLGAPVENVRQWRYIDGNPGVFTHTLLSGGEDRLSAFALSGGAPVELEPLHALASLEGDGISLYGAVAGLGRDYIFLLLAGDGLREVAGIELDAADAQRLPGVGGILSALSSGGSQASGAVEVVQYLYFPARIDPASGEVLGPAGTLAVNLEVDGADRHLYIRIDDAGVASAARSPEGEAAIEDGRATAIKGVGFEIVYPKLD